MSQKNQFMYTTCSELGIFMYWSGNSMNNLLSYSGLVDVKIRASDKDLPVQWVYNGKWDTFKKCKNYIEYICSGHHLSTMAFIFILNSKGVTICILFSLGTQLNAFLEICKCIVILWAAAWNLIHLFWFIFANIHAKMCF